MDQVRITDFTEHAKLKCVCMFVDEVKDKLLITGLFEKLKELLSGEEIERIFVDRHTPELKDKVIPMHDFKDTSLDVDFYFHEFDPDDKLKYFPTDFYYKPHFLFMVKIFKDQAEQDDYEQVVEFMKKHVKKLNFHSFFLVAVNLDEGNTADFVKVKNQVAITLNERDWLFSDLAKAQLRNYYAERLWKKFSEIKKIDVEYVLGLKKIDGMEECKYLKLYGDFALMLGSTKDAIRYYTTIERIFQNVVKQDKIWLASTYECLLATQSLIIDKIQIDPQSYDKEKRESVVNKMIQSLAIYTYMEGRYKKGGEVMVKYCDFLLKMGMRDEFMMLLSKFEHKMLNKKVTTLIKIRLAKYCADFEFFRLASMYLFSAFDLIEEYYGDEKDRNIEKVEIVLTIIQILGVVKSHKSSYLNKICPKSSLRPLVSKPVVDFLLSSLFRLNFAIDKRYIHCLMFILKLTEQKDKKGIWDAIISCSPNLTGETIEHDLDLPYFSYIMAKPNSRKVKAHKNHGVKAKAGLFIYDPRNKKVELNWSCNRSEDVIVYLYNPLPFDLVINSLTICTGDHKSLTHSGKINLAAFEKKKKVTIKLKILEEGEIKITGIKFGINNFCYTLQLDKRGMSKLFGSNPSMASYPSESTFKSQDVSKLRIYPCLPDIKASLLHDLDEVLAIGEEIDFNLKIQNTSDINAYLYKVTVILEFENSEPKKWVDEIVDMKDTTLVESDVRFIDIKLYQGHTEKDSDGEIERQRDNKWKITAFSKKIIARFYKIIVEIETSHQKDDSMYSLIRESFYFKTKELFKADVKVLDPYKLTDPNGKYFSTTLLYSAFIVESPDNEMEDLVEYRLRDMSTFKIIKECQYQSQTGINLNHFFKITKDDFNMEYFKDRYRLEWKSEILGRRGIIPCDFTDVFEPEMDVEWQEWVSSEEDESIKMKKILLNKDNDQAYEGRIEIRCPDLNAKCFFEGMRTFLFEATEKQKELNIKVVFIDPGVYELVIFLKDRKGQKTHYKSPQIIRI